MTPSYSFSKEEVQIIKAAWATDPGRLALQLIVERLGMLEQLSFDAQSERQSAFNEGRRYVGHSLARAINMPLKQPDEVTDATRGRTITATERAARAAARRRRPATER